MTTALRVAGTISPNFQYRVRLDIGTSGSKLLRYRDGNVTGLPLETTDAVKMELRRQLTSPVQWQRTIEYMVKEGVSTIIEIGPGKVLTGLIKRISKDVKTVNISDLASVKNLGV